MGIICGYLIVYVFAMCGRLYFSISQQFVLELVCLQDVQVPVI